jgi:hypothetical protein
MGAPTGAAVSAISAAPVNLTAAVSASRVVLTWISSVGDTASGSYVIEAGSASGLTNVGQFELFNGVNFPGQTYSIAFDNVPDGVYFVRVRFKSATGIVGFPSNEVTVIVVCAIPPNAPTGLLASVNGGSVTLNWTASLSVCAATSYLIEAGSASGLSNIASLNTGNTSTSFAASGVGPGAYFVRVRALNGGGTSGPTNEVIVAVTAIGCRYSYTPVSDEFGRGWNIPAAGGLRFVTVSTSSPGCAWVVLQDSSLPPWIQISPLAGASSTQITVQISPNTTGISRGVTIGFSPQANDQCSPFCNIESRITVNQSG